MTVSLLYHDPDGLGKLSPFDEAIVQIARDGSISLACPYIGLAYFQRIIQVTESWRLLTDVEEWLRSQSQTQREQVYEFLVKNRRSIRHYPRLHAKLVIGSRSAMLGSANLTSAGIRQRTEISVCLHDEPQIQELAEWFDLQWRRAHKLNTGLLKRIAAFMTKLPSTAALNEKPKPAISSLISTGLAKLVQLSDEPAKFTRGSTSGDVYFNFGRSEGWREWEDAMQHQFISAGGGRCFSAPLEMLSPGIRVWVYAPSYGYVGVARVTGSAEPASRFQVRTAAGIVRPIMEVVKSPKGYHRKEINDPDYCEYFVPVRWLDTKPLEEGVIGADLFSNPTIVCRSKTMKWRNTLRRLKRAFPNWNR